MLGSCTTKPERNASLVGEIPQEPSYGRLEKYMNSSNSRATIDLHLSGIPIASLQGPETRVLIKNFHMVLDKEMSKSYKQSIVRIGKTYWKSEKAWSHDAS